MHDAPRDRARATVGKAAVPTAANHRRPVGEDLRKGAIDGVDANQSG